MAINAEQSEIIIERLKALCNEHGDVPYIMGIKDEDGYWRYSMKCDATDSILLINIISRCALKEDEADDEDDASANANS